MNNTLQQNNNSKENNYRIFYLCINVKREKITNTGYFIHALIYIYLSIININSIYFTQGRKDNNLKINNY